MEKIFNTIGLSYRAQKIVMGTDGVVDGIRNHKVKLILLSDSASYNTQKIIQDKASYYNVDIMLIDELDYKMANVFSKENVKVIGITDKGFRDMILEKEKHGKG